MQSFWGKFCEMNGDGVVLALVEVLTEAVNAFLYILASYSDVVNGFLALAR